MSKIIYEIGALKDISIVRPENMHIGNKIYVMN